MTVTATGGGVTRTANLLIQIIGPVITTPSLLPGATCHVAYGKTLIATGGTTPYTWSLASGSTLPTGMTLSTAGVLGGTPSVMGEFTFTIQVSDKNLVVGVSTFSLNITAAPLVITTATLKSGIVGTAYSTILAAGGGLRPYTWAITSGALPPGIGLDTATGILNGTPAVGGTYSVTISVRDSEATPITVSKSFTITVAISPLAITTSILPAGAVGTIYKSTILTGTGGVKPYTWSVSAGKLPPGVGIASATGAISGTPVATGTYPVTVKLEDYAGTVPITRDYTIVINALSPAITTTTLPAGTAGTAYASSSLTATGGIKPYSWSITAGRLPPGIGYSSTTGTISGTPTAAGQYPVTFHLEDVSGFTATKELAIMVTTAPLDITTATLPAGTSGSAYPKTTLAATGGIKPYTWGVIAGTLPPGIGLNTASGVLNGIPQAKGIFTFSLQLSDLQSPPVSVIREVTISVN
jgi:hypothetical protein